MDILMIVQGMRGKKDLTSGIINLELMRPDFKF